jgi:hypothetical protein
MVTAGRYGTLDLLLKVELYVYALWINRKGVGSIDFLKLRSDANNNYSSLELE